MILYNHNFSAVNNEINVEEIEVRETDKMYIVADQIKRIGRYYRQVRKYDLNILMSLHDGCCMVSKQSNPELFKKMIIERQIEKLELAKFKVEREEKTLNKFLEIKV